MDNLFQSENEKPRRVQTRKGHRWKTARFTMEDERGTLSAACGG
jgi:hypothetical protein